MQFSDMLSSCLNIFSKYTDAVLAFSRCIYYGIQWPGWYDDVQSRNSSLYTSSSLAPVTFTAASKKPKSQLLSCPQEFRKAGLLLIQINSV